MDIWEIAKAFNDKYELDLKETICEITSGHFKSGLIELISE